MQYPKRHLVTSALPYANGPLHIGHLAGAYLPADIYVRHLRGLKKNVVFVCGSDENGAAITIKAYKEGKQPQEIIDKYHAMFQDSFRKMNINFDVYYRTSEPLHHETAQEFFTNLYDKGEFIEKTSLQYYDEKAQKFLADRYIQGTCPNCNYEAAYGDQCENCGSSLSPTDLINPVSTLTGEKPIQKETTHYYLQLDKHEEWLRKWINTGEADGKVLHDPKQWKKHVIGQCNSWLDAGLHPRAMTRDLDWGVDVPHQIPHHEGKKLYVWMDAPIGYISATKKWASDQNMQWEDYWQSDESSIIHFIGKDNIVFHCLIFPAILKAHGGYNLPVNVPANQFLNLEGKKISTSRNWAVWVHEYLEDWGDRVDELRYYLTRIMPESKDSEFTWKGFQEVVNTELVNNLANFINRVIVLVNKYYDGVVPEFDSDEAIVNAESLEEMSFIDAELLDLYDRLTAVDTSISKFDFRGAMSQLMEISSLGNQFLQFNEPWKNIKTNEEQVKTVMVTALQIVAALAVGLEPFLPEFAARLQKMLSIDCSLAEVMEQLSEGNLLVSPGHTIAEPTHLFTRIEDERIDKAIAKLEASNMENDHKPTIHYPAIKDTIQFEDFAKLDVRIGTVTAAEKMKKADKLLILSVNLGFETRTIVSGIAKFYTPEEMLGKQVMVVVNLAPRKLRGVESQGMILMAENADGHLALVSPIEPIQEGSQVS